MARTRVNGSIRWWLAAPLLAAASFAMPVPAWAVDEFYSRDLYPWLQRGLTTVSNLVPMALLDGLLALLAVAVVYRTIRLLLTAASGRPIDAIWEGVRRVLRATGAVVLVFMLAWGTNYRRLPLESVIDREAAGDLTVAALAAAVADANTLGARLRSRHQSLELTYAEAADHLRTPLNAALEELNREPLRVTGQPKVSRILTPFFTLAGINGLINPFGLESIVHPDLVPAERPFVLAHEWAHLSGHADEAEANAVAWLACMKGGPALAYSASVYLIMEAGGALPDAERQRAFARLDAGIRDDIGRISRRTLAQNPEVQRVATRVYDEYLRANQVADGTRSYGRALTLILASPFREALAAYEP